MADRRRRAAKSHARSDARGREPGRQGRQPVDRPRAIPRGRGGSRRRRVRHLEDGEQAGLEDAELGAVLMRWTLPNILTLARICLTPVIALLPFIQGYWPKVIAFLIFLAASASDVVDGYLARRRNEVSELGQLLDPIADKLLLFATLIPIFWLTRHPTTLFWFAWKDALAAHPWAGWFRNFWDQFHGAVVAVTLAGAILLTVYSLVVYLYHYRALFKGG